MVRTSTQRQPSCRQMTSVTPCPTYAVQWFVHFLFMHIAAWPYNGRTKARARLNGQQCRNMSKKENKGRRNNSKMGDVEYEA
mmetsp:Transcript_35412/g.92172  ORF Transcript_35412/g.92172 Transcript_35412/m.92172 type:complete len:82 (-) Transcript_35412:428-673(-)